MKRFRIFLQRLRAFRFRRGSFSVNRLRNRSKSILCWPSRDQTHLSRRRSRMEKSQQLRGNGSLGHRNRALLLACNPCTGSSSGMVVESYKFQIQGDRKPPPQENWQRERAWSIVTRVGDEFVTKKVILKKMKVKKVSANARNGDFSGENSRFRGEDDPLENSSSSSRYRLSTSSSNADTFGGESQMYSWDKELSFTSGDDHEELWSGCFDREVLDRLEGSTKDVFVDLPSCNVGRSVHKHFPSPDRRLVSSEELKLDDEGGDELGQTENVRFLSGFQDQQACDLNLVSSSVLNVNQQEAPGDTTEPQVSHGVKPSESESNFPGKKKSQEGDGTTDSSGSTDEQAGKGMGVPVAKVSCDPYSDYRESMLEMSLAYGLQEMCEYEELLRSYLELNPPECHGTIVEAFIEIVRHRLFI